jgi:NAD(P)-dependent dehydrogenase (short-subunit alcohol dehydrogenase family)
VKLAGAHAVITGGGSGIGAAIAAALASDGARVTLVGRRPEPLRETASRIDDSAGPVFAQPADVTIRSQVEDAFDAARKANGPITILVHSAGAAASSPFADISSGDWRAMLAVNLEGLFNCCQAALPDLVQASHGRIVAIASTAAVKGYAYTAPYCAAKHGALGLIRAIAAEFARTGLTANAVCPGFTDTAILSESVARIRTRTGRSEDQARSALAAFNPQQRLVEPEEVASAVAWLCLPQSRSVNGQAVAVAGGEI